MDTLNAVYSSLASRRRYEVWFIRLGLASGRGAWWFRFLLLNPGRDGCSQTSLGMPVQVWATIFPTGEKPRTFIQGFALDDLRLSRRGQPGFGFNAGNNQIDENSCRGGLKADGHRVEWNLNYRSSFAATLSNKGWIGFSRTPHSDAIFSGSIRLDEQIFEGEPLGFGLQGHNCGYRHRNFWTWAHAYFIDEDGKATTLEALVYDLPLGLTFRRAVLWHAGKRRVFRITGEQEDRDRLRWKINGVGDDGSTIEAAIDGEGMGYHRLPYLKTNCAGTFEVANNSLASATLVCRKNAGVVELRTGGGAVLEMGGKRRNQTARALAGFSIRD